MNAPDTPKSLLVIDDEDSICLAFRRFFEKRGWRVFAASSASEGAALHEQFAPHVVFLDVRLPDRSGLSLLDGFANSDSEVVVITAYGGFDTVIQAIHGRAFDCLAKPLDLDEALALADRIWKSRQGAGESAPDESKPDLEFLVGDSPAMRLVGDSPAMQEVYKLIARAAGSAGGSVSASATNMTTPVLIDGETGTGKELVARAIHRFSDRRKGPFIALNCGAIPENLIESELFGHIRGAFTGAETDHVGNFQSADGGCLLLDEVGDLPLGVQVKLLRVLDDQRIVPVGASHPIALDVRVLAVTNKRLEEEVHAGRFRRDLYYRLNVLRISLPPLRGRKGDIEPLVAHFLKLIDRSSGSNPGITPESVRELTARDWPGNVRELKNAILRAAANNPNGPIRLEDLSTGNSAAAMNGRHDDTALSRAAIEYSAGIQSESVGRFHQTLQCAERALIANAMRRFLGRQSEAADYLGLHRNTLRTKLREYGLGSRHSNSQGQDQHG
jgi:two-component system nitrogen regulation response regulator GlnG